MKIRVKKEGIYIFSIVLIFLLFVKLPIVSAETYFNFDKVKDNIKLFFSFGDNKVQLALEIREKEVLSVIEYLQKGNLNDAIKNFDNAEKKLNVIQNGINLKNADKIKESSKRYKRKIR